MLGTYGCPLFQVAKVRKGLVRPSVAQATGRLAPQRIARPSASTFSISFRWFVARASSFGRDAKYASNNVIGHIV